MAAAVVVLAALDDDAGTAARGFVAVPGADRAEEDAVAAVARVCLCRGSGLEGVSFFSCACAAALVLLVVVAAGLVADAGGAGDGASFLLGGASLERVDLAVARLGAVDTEDSGDGLRRRILSRDEFDSVKIFELGRVFGSSSVDKRNLFWGDATASALCGGGGGAL